MLYNYGLWILTAFVLFAIGLLLLIWYHVSGRRLLRRGDMVLYCNPNDPENINMITVVLKVFYKDGVATIRGPGTTITAAQRWMQRLDVVRPYPLQVPEEPFAEASVLCASKIKPLDLPVPYGTEARWLNNRARFARIPLTWFPYMQLFPCS